MQTEQKNLEARGRAQNCLQREAEMQQESHSFDVLCFQTNTAQKVGKFSLFILPTKCHLYFIIPLSRLRQIFIFLPPLSNRAFSVVSFTPGKQLINVNLAVQTLLMQMTSYFPIIMMFRFFLPKVLTTYCTFLDVVLNQKTRNYKIQNSTNTTVRLDEFCHQKEKFSFLWHQVKDKHKNHCKSHVNIQLGFKTLHARGHFTLSWGRAGNVSGKAKSASKCPRNSMVRTSQAPGCAEQAPGTEGHP